SDFEKSYVYSWHDYLGRATTVADYGVCAVAPSYSAASPPTDADSDVVLVTRYAYGYGSDGMASPVDRLYTEVVAKNESVETEPATRTYVDWLGRTVVVWENYGATAGDADTRYTAYEYDNADRLTKIKAAYKYESSVWYTQDTDYTYDKRGRVTKATYPHSGEAASTDEVTTAWADERDEITSRTDQNGTQVDYTIVAKQLGGSGDWLLCVLEAVNAGCTVPPVGDQAMETYGDGLGRTVAVVTYGDEDFEAADETTRVGYGYANGTQNLYNQLRYERQALTSSQRGDYVVYGYDGYGRRTDLYYPDDSDSAPDSRHLVTTVDDLGRMTGLKVDQGSDFLVYSYLGYGLAEKKYPEPGANGHVLSLYNADASINGTDLFGRVTDQRIVAMDGNGAPQTADANRVVRIKYGYDDYSNRTYRKDELHPDGSQAYSYDRLHRLVESKQAKLDASGSPVGYRPILYDTDWTLSKLGNWDELQRVFRGGSASKDIRTHSLTNELTLRDMDDAVGSQTLIYEEFADEQGWAEADGSTWTVSDGTYYCQALDSGQGITLTGEADYHNMSLSVLLNWGENPGAGDQAGLVFAWQDDQNYWRCWFDRSDMRLRLVQISGGVAGSVSTGAVSGSAPTILYLYVNQGYVYGSGGGTVSRSATVASGKIGLYANNTTTRFDNVEAVDHRRDMGFRPGWTVDGGRTIWSGGTGYYTLAHTDPLTGTFSLRNSAVFRGCHMDDGRIEVKIAETSGSTTGGAIFLWQSPNNYWAVVALNGDLRCIRVADGAESWVAIDDTNLPMTAEFWIQVTFSGQNLTVKHGTDGQNWTSTSINASAVLTGGAEDGYCGFGHYEPLRIGEYRILSADGSTTEFSDSFASDQKTLVHDHAGNLTFDGVYYYEYDYRNRLGRVTRCGSADGSADFEASGLVKSASASKLGSVIASYTYDGLNRRLRKVVAGSGSLDQDTRFYYSGWRCVEERTVTDDDPQSWAERPWKRYTWGGRYLDELVRYEADTTADGSVDTDYYVHQDALYNVVAVVANGGDDDGLVVERMEYDPYGRARLFDKTNAPLATSALGLDYLFTGQRRDSETGLYYYKNRYYDADTGRFTSKDPVGYGSGSLNLYGYVGGKPIVFVDPMGTAEDRVGWWDDVYGDIPKETKGLEIGGKCTSGDEGFWVRVVWDIEWEAYHQTTTGLSSDDPYTGILYDLLGELLNTAVEVGVPIAEHALGAGLNVSTDAPTVKEAIAVWVLARRRVRVIVMPFDCEDCKWKFRIGEAYYVTLVKKESGRSNLNWGMTFTFDDLAPHVTNALEGIRKRDATPRFSPGDVFK
ncbi:MAG TPA: RHS repeat-associated core domain-containing protein, partial [Phycisphaerae bacterium]|nr:RHS repeat-associated core domain-containing protein [Phycisphaerae bacterium]